MKAYKVWTDDSDKGCGIVFAESFGKARQQAQGTDACEDEEFINIRVARLPLLDGMENEEPSDNLWLNEKIRKILVKEGWYCYEPNVYEKCEDCCAKEHCDYYLDIVSESEAEKARKQRWKDDDRRSDQGD